MSVAVGALQGLDPATGMSTDRPIVSPLRYAEGMSKLQEQDAAQCGNLVSPAAPVPL
ncbi:hypothetical protein ElyMa_001788500, partial [Elysia marginata]